MKDVNETIDLTDNLIRFKEANKNRIINTSESFKIKKE
jgi:hypothetical protein